MDSTALSQKVEVRNTKTTKKSRRTRELNIPIAPGRRLSISIKKTKKKTKKSAQKRKKTKLQTAVTILLILGGLSGAVFFGYRSTRVETQLRVYTPPAPQAILPPAPKTPGLPESEPERLRIPDVGIESSLPSIGKQEDGSIEVPSQADIAGWYRQGPTPGELGPAIIVGHVDSPKGPGIFWRLRELVPGQIVEVSRKDGTTAKFRVETVKEFSQNSFPTAEVYGNIDHPGLRLITCGGSFNQITRKYSHNTVVFARLIT